MEISWQDSGKGSISLSLVHAQKLAIQAGFVFNTNADATEPLNKRANLQKMFEHFGVNSLTAFRQKFTTYELNPHIKQNIAIKPIWAAQKRGNEHYVGQLITGKPHGPGLLLCKGPSSAPFAYLGSFENGLRNGFGVILSSRGETFHGYFKDDVFWGPGSYTFPRPSSSLSAQDSIGINTGGSGRHRVRFDGMHNGRPCGKGVLVWSDGVRECGEFDGMTLRRAIDPSECDGVVIVAQNNAEMAKRLALETEEELRRHGLWQGMVEEAMTEVRGQGVGG